jgi:hypothetical protein
VKFCDTTAWSCATCRKASSLNDESSQTDQDEAANLITAARAFVDLLVKKDFAPAVAQFDDTMKAALKSSCGRLGMPQLILQDERDYQVTMEDFKKWNAVLAKNSNVTLKSYLETTAGASCPADP